MYESSNAFTSLATLVIIWIFYSSHAYITFGRVNICCLNGGPCPWISPPENLYGDSCLNEDSHRKVASTKQFLRGKYNLKVGEQAGSARWYWHQVVWGRLFVVSLWAKRAERHYGGWSPMEKSFINKKTSMLITFLSSVTVRFHPTYKWSKYRAYPRVEPDEKCNLWMGQRIIVVESWRVPCGCGTRPGGFPDAIQRIGSAANIPCWVSLF